jgi:glutamate racemase
MSPQARVAQVPSQDSRSPTSPIGIFDSGIGGLSIYRALSAHLPGETLYYLADQAHVPYGSRPLADIRDLSTRITQFMLARQAKLIVVACNTASAAALQALRKSFPATPFVGMEPAVKPAAFSTQSGRIGVLATPATFSGAPYGSLLDRFTQEVTVLEDTCQGLVSQIEKGEWESSQTRFILENALQPMLEQGVDRIVLGCTHYAFVIPLIKTIIGPEVQVIDPAPAIARQAERLLTHQDLLNLQTSRMPDRIWTTGDPNGLKKILPAILGSSWPGDADNRVLVRGLDWIEGELSGGRPD